MSTGHEQDKLEILKFTAHSKPNPLIGDTTTWVVVASAADVTSDWILIQNHKYFGLHFRALSSAGGVDVTLKVEASSHMDSNVAVQLDNTTLFDGSAATKNTTSENWQYFSISPKPAPLIRFIIDGQAGNSADTVCFGALYLSD